MKRRDFVAGACLCGFSLLHRAALAQSPWSPPARFVRPELASDEGGLWSMMDREEARLRRSPFAIRDAELRDYVQDLACRLGGSHCRDIRVHLVHTPLFNASMAPNGMMQVWSGLMLRMENEAQLAAVLGHEIGHYLERHTLDRLRDAKSRTAFAQFLGAFGVVGAIGQLGVLAGGLAYSRDQERDADRIGVQLVHQAGYDAAEATKVWQNMLLESKARQGDDGRQDNPMLASHPAPEEREETLAALAKALPGGVKNENQWRERTRRFRREWLMDEIKRGRQDESIALFTRMLRTDAADAEVLYARGEAYRLRGQETDFDAALADFDAACRAGGEPPETHRSMGLIYRLRNRNEEAAEGFRRYLAAAPNAPDALMVKSYLEGMEK